MKILPRQTQSGQALLVILLSMAVILTLVLSVASSSITDVTVTTFEEDALRAFSAAEAGVEKALLSGVGSGGSVQVDPTSDPNLTYTSTISNPAAGQDFAYPGELNAGESATFWFVERNNSGNFICAGNCSSGPNLQRLCFGVHSPFYSAGEVPAVVLSVYYDWNTAANTIGNLVSSQDFTHLKVARRGYDPVAARLPSNNFTNAQTSTCTIGGTNFGYRVNPALMLFSDMGIPINCRNTDGCLIMAKVKVLYNDSTLSDDPIIQRERVAISKPSAGGLPAQGNQIESVGSAGDSTRKVNVFQAYPEPPGIFDSALFSSSDISK